MLQTEPDTSDPVMARAHALLEAGHAHDAIDLLDAEHRTSGSPALARELVRVRHLAFELLDRTHDLGPPPDLDPIAPPQPGELPVNGPDGLSVAGLRSSLATHGCLWLRGLLDTDTVAILRQGVDSTLDAFDAIEAGRDADDGEPGEAWYVPFEPAGAYAEYRYGGRRKWSRKSGSVWTADSPEMLALLTRTLAEIGIARVIEDHLGERPALSVNKCSLRRVPIDTGGEWHQDGAFLGTEVRTVNVWMALDDCGRDAPGMDVVPTRCASIAPCGTEGAMFEWSVSPEVVVEAAGGVPITRPEFQAGDILLFDQFFLHRTATEPEMTRERHAIECWFFAPSAYPLEQIPLVF